MSEQSSLVGCSVCCLSGGTSKWLCGLLGCSLCEGIEVDCRCKEIIIRSGVIL